MRLVTAQGCFIIKVKEIHEKEEREKRWEADRLETEKRKKEEKERFENLERAAKAGDIQAKKEVGEHYRKDALKDLNARIARIESYLGFGIAEVNKGYTMSQGVVNNCYAALQELTPFKKAIEESAFSGFDDFVKWFDKMKEVEDKHKPYYT